MLNRRLRLLGAAIVAILAAALLLATNVFGLASGSAGKLTLSNGTSLNMVCASKGPLSNTNVGNTAETVNCGAAPTTTTPTPPPPTDPGTQPPPTTTPPPSGTYSCTAQLGDSCGGYDYSKIPMSNGYNTYVQNQGVGPASGAKETVNANNPGDWDVVANLPSCGGCVQTFPAVQQLTNNWCGSVTNFSSCGSPTDLPLSALNSLKISYNETSPGGDPGNQYEFAPDIWDDNYGSDVMFWVDTSPTRCTNNGMGAGWILGQATLDGQNWTVYRYGGQAGDEIIFILDANSTTTDPVDDNACAQQSSGTVDIKAGYDWLVNKGAVSSNVVFSQLNTGWELTQSNGGTFTVHDYAIEVS